MTTSWGTDLRIAAVVLNVDGRAQLQVSAALPPISAQQPVWTSWKREKSLAAAEIRTPLHPARSVAGVKGDAAILYVPVCFSVMCLCCCHKTYTQQA